LIQRDDGQRRELLPVHWSDWLCFALIIKGRNTMTDIKINLEGLSPKEEFIVKWQFRLLGDFKKALIECIMRADDENLARLEYGFPDEVGGYLNYTRTPEWWDIVKKKANINWE